MLVIRDDGDIPGSGNSISKETKQETEAHPPLRHHHGVQTFVIAEAYIFGVGESEKGR